MSLQNTDEIEIITVDSGLAKSDSKRAAYFFAALIGLSLFIAVGLIIAALDEVEQPNEPEFGDETQITSNETRIADADINLEDVVEDPSQEQLELMVDSNFFEEVGFDDEIVERLNKQAEQAIEDFKQDLPQLPSTDLELPDLPDADIELPDLAAERERVTELLESADVADLSDVEDLANQISGFLE